MNVPNLTGIFKLPTETPAASRRTFLKISGGAGAGLILGLAAPVQISTAKAATAASGLAPNPFLIVAPDNTVTVIIKHLDKGQGAATGLATLVAEELDADWSQIRTEFAPSDPIKYKNFAFGVQGVGSGEPRSYAISRLPSRALRIPIRATLKNLDEEWLAEAVDLPLYGSGETPGEAQEMLERDIEALWDELNEPGELSEAWVQVRRFLGRVIEN